MADSGRFRGAHGAVSLSPVALAVAITALAPGRGEASFVPAESYAVTAWTTESGLPAAAGSVLAITQDREGHLWLGTRSGLIRFDGFQFLPWGSHGEAPLPGKVVRALFSARDGSLWMAFADAAGVTQIRDGGLINHSGDGGLPRGLVQALLQDRDGSIWTGGLGGLARFDGERWTSIGPDDGLLEADVYSLYQDSSGDIWVGTSEGMFRRVAGSRTFELAHKETAFVQSMTEDRLGAIWVTDPRQTVKQLQSNKPPAYPPDFPLPAVGTRLLRDRRGQVWVAALASGLLRVQETGKAGGALLDPFPRGNKITGLVHSLFEDREDNVWVGMTGGLLRLSQRLATGDIPLEGLTNEGVRALTVDREGAVWVATRLALHRFLGQQRKVYGFRQTMALHTDQNGRVWIATPERISLFANGRFTPVLDALFQQVASITTDSDGTLWLCDRGRGLIRWRQDAPSSLNTVGELADHPCNVVYTDQHGRVWAGFRTGGIVVHQAGRFHAYDEADGLAPGPVSAIFEDGVSGIWIATRNGLSMFHDGRFITITGQNGLPEKIERSVIEDEFGDFWLSVSEGSGIIRFSRKEIDKVATNPTHQIEYVLYDESDGLPPVYPHWSQPAAVRGRDGRLWFATGAGVAVLDPRNLPAIGLRSVAPRIEGIVADGRAFAAERQLALQSGTSNVQIEYTAVSLSGAGKVRFRYMLEGFSNEWVYAGTRRQAFYTNLAPGNYRFRVAATNDGVRHEPEAVWDFTILPAFYETRWFWALVVAAVASAIWGYWWMSLRAVRNKYALVLAERARVSRDIHDTLLQSLGAVGLELEVVASELDRTAGAGLQRLSAQVQRCISEARQSIWDLRSPGLESRSLVDALRDLAEHGNWGKPVQIYVAGNGHPRRRAPQAEEQVLLIAREAISNAIHHAGAQHVHVAVMYRRNAAILRVSDDGCGFDPGNLVVHNSHCGLASMKERAERLHGHFEVVSSPGAGTVIEAVVPMRG